MAETVLSSLWGGLSPHLIASFYKVGKDGKRDPENITVRVPLSEANLDATLNWQSAFEQSGPETKAPTLFAMLQSGAIEPIASSAMKGVTSSSAQQKSSSFLQQFEGRTGITKLNSVQVFNGMPPVKIQVTAVFRAWKDGVSEVEDPFDQLMKWALPAKLASDSTVFSRAIDFTKGSKEWLDALLPSESPTLIAMKYKGRTFAPMVIESIGQPLSSPIDAFGSFVELSVPMTLATLTAIDRDDWAINFKK